MNIIKTVATRSHILKL